MSRWTWCKVRRVGLFLGGLAGLGWQTTSKSEKDPELMATFEGMIAASGVMPCGDEEGGTE